VSNSTSRALIIGGSMGGLFAALLLRKAGWDAEVFERVNTELSGRGAGIVTHAELCSVLKAAGFDPTKDLGVDVEGRKAFDRLGRVIAIMRVDKSLRLGTACFACCEKRFRPSTITWARN
jgi:2-polyprenyl-6-methoxyphenol hydroxylase-like FAD-dependent oxidoreductase